MWSAWQRYYTVECSGAVHMICDGGPQNGGKDFCLAKILEYVIVCSAMQWTLEWWEELWSRSSSCRWWQHCQEQCTVHITHCHEKCTVDMTQCTASSVQCTVTSVQSRVSRHEWTVHSAHFKSILAQCTVCSSAQQVMHFVQCNVIGQSSVHCTVHSHCCFKRRHLVSVHFLRSTFVHYCCRYSSLCDEMALQWSLLQRHTGHWTVTQYPPNSTQLCPQQNWYMYDAYNDWTLKSHRPGPPPLDWALQSSRVGAPHRSLSESYNTPGSSTHSNV